MANRRDPRRADLIVPYFGPEKDKDASDVAGTMSSTLPMAAIFTRNKLLGWTAVMFAVQHWMSETPAQKAAAPTPAYFSVAMAVLSLAVGYMPFFMPPPAGRVPMGGTGTQPAEAVPSG